MPILEPVQNTMPLNSSAGSVDPYVSRIVAHQARDGLGLNTGDDALCFHPHIYSGRYPRR